MKKVTTSKILSIALLSTLVLTVFSCSNFFSGSELKNQLEDKINYANAPSLTIKIYPENSDYGNIIGNSEIKAKVTDTVPLEFNCSSNFVFTEWKAFVNGSPDDSEEYVTIHKKNELKTTATINNYTSLIEIKPVCANCLQIVSTFPEWGYAYPCDTDIEVVFNSQISEDNFRFTLDDFEALGLVEGTDDNRKISSGVQLYKDSNDKIYAYTLYNNLSTLTYKNIEIKCNNDNYLDYFLIPGVADNILKIPANHNNSIPVETDEQKKIEVHIGQKIYTASNIQLKSERNWAYRINNRKTSEADENDPIAGDLFVAKNIDSLSENNLFITEKTADQLSDDEILKNCITKSFAFSYTATDKESGIKTIYLKEQFTNHTDGTPVTSTGVITEFSSDSFIYSSDGYSTTVKTDYELKKLNQDGAYYFTVWAEDNNNNKTKEKHFTVITHKNFALDGWKLYNDETTYSNFTLITQKPTLYKDVKLDVDFDITCGTDPANVTSSIKSILTDNNDGTYSFVYDSSVCDGALDNKITYLLVTATELATGNEKSFMQIVPKKISKQYEYKYHQTDTKTKITTYSDWYLTDSSYGIKYSSSANGNEALKEFTTTAKQSTPSNSYFNITCFFESDFGKITADYTRFFVRFTDCEYGYRLNLTALNLGVSPVTFEVTEGEKIKGGFTSYNIKVSGLVEATDKSRSQYADYCLKINNADETNYVYFSGTETSFIVPDSHNKDFNYELYAVDPTHIGSVSKKSTANDTKSPIYWEFTYKDYSNRNYLSYSENDITYLILGNMNSGNVRYCVTTQPSPYSDSLKSYTLQNFDYTGDYIKFRSASELNNANPKEVYLNKQIVYYKKADETLLNFICDNGFKTNTYYGDNFVIKNPRSLIDSGVYTYEQIETEFDSLEVTSLSDPTGCYVPVWNLEDGYYVMFIKAFDNSNRVSWASFVYQKKKSDYSGKNSFTLASNVVKNSGAGSYTNDTSNYLRFRVDYLSGKTWIKGGEAEVYSGNDLGYYKNTYSKTETVSLNTTSSFMKIYYQDSYFSSFGNHGANNSLVDYKDIYDLTDTINYHAPLYIYPDGTTNPTKDASNLENLVETDSISVLCTKPTLIQTFYSKTNFEKDVNSWELYTKKDQVLNPVIISSSENYEIPVDSIPDGYYYCAIARFSDGCTKITSVKKK